MILFTLIRQRQEEKFEKKDLLQHQVMLFILIFNNTVLGNLTVMDETSISHEKSLQ